MAIQIAMIPARGGSKRIPRKNIRSFVGRPIISYSIQAALESGLFDRVIVSTDDDEIAAIAKQWGAEIPFTRPATLADDHASTIDVIKHALQWFQDQGQEVQYACCIYPTAPFIQAYDLLTSHNMLVESGKDYVFTVASSPFPVQRAFTVYDDKHIEMFQPENYGMRSQDLKPSYYDAGQFYWGKTEAFFCDRPLFAPHSLAYILPRQRAQDIDTPEDWEYAELLFKLSRH